MLTPKPLRAVLFDWDGTLLDSYGADAATYVQVFRALGFSWQFTDLEKHYSPNWHNVYRAANLPTDRWEEADRLWRQFYQAERPVLQPDAKEVVEELSIDYAIGLVTSGSAWRVRAQLCQFAMAELFSACVFGDDVPVTERKPHPAALEIILKRMKLDPAACVYVGDAPEDVEMARQANVASVGLIGHSPVAKRLRAARPNAIIADVAALRDLLGHSGNS